MRHIAEGKKAFLSEVLNGQYLSISERLRVLGKLNVIHPTIFW